MISTSSASVLLKSLQLITNAWAYEIAFSLYTYTHKNRNIVKYRTASIQARAASFEKQGNSGPSS